MADPPPSPECLADRHTDPPSPECLADWHTLLLHVRRQESLYRWITREERDKARPIVAELLSYVTAYLRQGDELIQRLSNLRSGGDEV